MELLPVGRATHSSLYPRWEVWFGLRCSIACLQPTVHPRDKDVMRRIRYLQQVLLHTVPRRNHGKRPKCVLYSMTS